MLISRLFLGSFSKNMDETFKCKIYPYFLGDNPSRGNGIMNRFQGCLSKTQTVRELFVVFERRPRNISISADYCSTTPFKCLKIKKFSQSSHTLKLFVTLLASISTILIIEVHSYENAQL